MAKVTDAQAAQYYNQQPKKRAGAGILIFNESDELLIVKPSYLEKWLWIGGGVEDNESPMAAALRECQEEIGAVPANIWLAFVNYMPPQSTGQNDILQFLFTADRVDADFLHTLKLQKNEIDDAMFVPVEKLGDYLHDFRARAAQTYYANRDKSRTLYLENGNLA